MKAHLDEAEGLEEGVDLLRHALARVVLGDEPHGQEEHGEASVVRLSRLDPAKVGLLGVLVRGQGRGWDS